MQKLRYIVCKYMYEGAKNIYMYNIHKHLKYTGAHCDTEYTHVQYMQPSPGRLLTYPPSSRRCPSTGSQRGGRYPERDILDLTYLHRHPDVCTLILESVMSVVTQKYGIQRSWKRIKLHNTKLIYMKMNDCERSQIAIQ